MSKVAREKVDPFCDRAGGASAYRSGLTTDTIHYEYDTTALGNGYGQCIVKEAARPGFFVTADLCLHRYPAAGRKNSADQGGCWQIRGKYGAQGARAHGNDDSYVSC